MSNVASSNTGARDNNFLFVRYLAAATVLLCHAFPVSSGPQSFPWVVNALGMPLYQIAVDVFFVLSGYLVTSSLLSRNHLGRFALARARRILPALAMSLVLTLLVCGLFFSQAPPSTFFTSSGTWTFLLTNILPLLKARTELAGCFPGTPLEGVVNACLWTLPWEIRMYLILGILHLVATRIAVFRVSRTIPAIFFASLCATVATQFHLAEPPPILDLLIRFCAAFFGGGTLYLWRDRLRPEGIVVLAMAASWASAFVHQGTFQVVYTVTLPLLTIWLATVPSAPLRRVNRLGDASYGIYIYGFPLQQILTSQFHLSAGALAIVSLALAFALSMVSWKYLEKPLLAPGNPSRN